MAGFLPSCNFNPPVAFDRARATQPLPEVPNQPPAGSLVIIDDFEDTFQSAAHGNVGAYAARQQGFRGPIYAETVGSEQPGPRNSTSARTWMNLQPQDPAQVRQAVQDYSRFSHRELLEDVTGDLNKVRERGLHDSAVNVSYGAQPQRSAETLLRDVRSGTMPGSPTFQMSQNILKAYDIDSAKLTNPDAKVSGPERHRLHQALLQATEAGAQAPDVKQAQANYDQAVGALQAQNNSVVVSAGNQEQILQSMANEAGGLKPTAGPDSNHNVLANAQVVTVGATRWREGAGGLQERVAGYSNRDPEVDIYASGSVGNGVDQNRLNVAGTSFSSPRVAAALASLHGTHPGSNSVQMRNLMQNRLTHSLQDGGQNVSVLDFAQTERYMREGRF
ncbi:S8 family serine peptidase [bacterium]|nr:S8 family serine peptidase [bacterium]